jgi:hypothetical protein
MTRRLGSLDSPLFDNGGNIIVLMVVQDFIALPLYTI